MKKTLCTALAFLSLLSSCSNPAMEESSQSVSSSVIEASSVSIGGNSDFSLEESSDEASLPTSTISANSSAARSESSQSSRTSSGTGIDWGNIGGTKLIMMSPSHGTMIATLKPLFSWSDIKADSYTFYLDEKSGNSFRQAEKKTGIKVPEYQIQTSLKEGLTYRWRIQAVTDGKTVEHNGINVNGDLFMTAIPYKKHPANIGLNFTFDGTIPEQVLKNYLSRSMTMSFLSVPSGNLANDVRMILNTGVKYVSRAAIPWQAETDYTDTIARYRGQIEAIHKIDPEIVFETCIFETVYRSCEQVAIPDWVFKAFGQTVVKRNFDYEKMLFPSGKYVDHWEKGASIPDITRIETQMYFYYRGCRYIDAGFEAIHWGQVMLIGENDTDYKDYNTVLTKIRQYAKINARRHFVFNNGHTHGMTGPDGVLLFDFHSYPLRIRSAPGETAHAPSQDNPQEAVIEKNYLDSIYGKSLGGKTYSGWSCSSLPYFVEIDNFSGVMQGSLNKPGIDYWPWGMDEISWFANQPQDYRASWMNYAYQWIRGTDAAGYMCFTGSRPAYMIKDDKIVWYYANSRDYGDAYWGDEETIRSIWVNDNK
ncbi:MAG: hypothetical protein ACYCYM_03760 [Saccharofermentanales bacterium]